MRDVRVVVIPRKRGELLMWDIVMVAVGLVSFALLIAYVYACEKL